MIFRLSRYLVVVLWVVQNFNMFIVRYFYFSTASYLTKLWYSSFNGIASCRESNWSIESAHDVSHHDLNVAYLKHLKALFVKEIASLDISFQVHARKKLLRLINVFWKLADSVMSISTGDESNFNKDGSIVIDGPACCCLRQITF